MQAQVSFQRFHSPPAKSSSTSTGGDGRDNRDHPALSMLHTLDSAAACEVLGEICALDQRYPQYTSHTDMEGKHSVSKVVIAFHSCSPGDLTKAELLLSRDVMFWARGRAGLQKAMRKEIS